MNIVILTSKNHYYANLLLQLLLKKGTFDTMNILVIEQDALVPGKTKLQGLCSYLKKAGVRYVGVQIMKQCLFSVRAFFDRFFHRSRSSFFPYYQLKTDAKIVRIVVSTMHDAGVVQRLKIFKPNLILSLYSKDILGVDILSIPLQGAVNLHPSLLPSYRGVSPTFWILARGETVAGSTLHELDTGIDTGRVIAQTSFLTHSFSSEHQLYRQATIAGAQLVHDYVQQIKNGQSPTTITPKYTSSYFSVPTRDATIALFRRGVKMFSFWDIFQS